MEQAEIIFVYNADSGVWNGLMDLIHKNVSPETYACSLCALTYSNIGMINRWRQAVYSLPVPVKFLHRDELQLTYRVGPVSLPAAFCHDAEGLQLWLDHTVFDESKNLEDLIGAVFVRAESLRTAHLETIRTIG